MISAGTEQFLDGGMYRLPFIGVQICTKEGNFVERFWTRSAEFFPKGILVEAEIIRSWEEIGVSLNPSDYLQSNSYYINFIFLLI